RHCRTRGVTSGSLRGAMAIGPLLGATPAVAREAETHRPIGDTLVVWTGDKAHEVPDFLAASTAIAAHSDPRCGDRGSGHRVQPRRRHPPGTSARRGRASGSRRLAQRSEALIIKLRDSGRQPTTFALPPITRRQSAVLDASRPRPWTATFTILE